MNSVLITDIGLRGCPIFGMESDYPTEEAPDRSMIEEFRNRNNNTAKIYVRWIAPGKIEYFFKIKCGEKAFEEISVKDISTELIPIFNKAEQVNSATEIAIAFVAFMSAIASPVPGDEAAAGAALNRLLTVAGVI